MRLGGTLKANLVNKDDYVNSSSTEIKNSRINSTVPNAQYDLDKNFSYSNCFNHLSLVQGFARL